MVDSDGRVLNANVDLGATFSFSRSPRPLGGGNGGVSIFLEMIPHGELISASLSLPAPSILKRAPRERPGRVTFDGITVYYFPRCQGFTSVPSRGGCTLGMAPRHSACRLFSLAEFTQEQVRVRREKLRQRLKEEKLETLRWKVWRPMESVCTCSVSGEVYGEGSRTAAITRANRMFAECIGGPGIC